MRDRDFFLTDHNYWLSGQDPDCGLVECPFINAKIWILKSFFGHGSAFHMGPHSLQVRTVSELVAAVEYEWEDYYAVGHQDVFEIFREEHEERLRMRRESPNA